MGPIRDPEISRRFRDTLDLIEFGIQIMRQNLRRWYPNEIEEETRRRWVAWMEKRPYDWPSVSAGVDEGVEQAYEAGTRC